MVYILNIMMKKIVRKEQSFLLFIVDFLEIMCYNEHTNERR